MCLLAMLLATSSRQSAEHVVASYTARRKKEKVEGREGKIQGKEEKVQGKEGKVQGKEGKVQGKEGKV